jgi:hypothetical protein
MSVWGTGNDIVYTNPPMSTVDALATRAANFYNSLQVAYDVVFAEFSDRDAGFKQYVYGDGGASWWDTGDFQRNVRFLTTFVNVAQKRVVMWQIPFGNTKMRAMNNTWNHYQDNRVEWLLDDPSRAHLNEYINAGVIGFLFGRGAGGATCACDAAGDGTTNPAPINGNTLMSLNADDDGGFFRQKAAAYYTTGALSLAGSSAPPAPTSTPPVPTSTLPAATATTVPPTSTLPPATSTLPAATSTPTRTATPAATPTTPPAASWTSSATVSPSSVRRGGVARINATVRSSVTTRALIDVEVYAPNGARVHQTYVDNVTMTGGVNRQIAVKWTVPANAATGTYTVRIGVFSPGWGTLYHWNHFARTFTVTQ